MTAASTAVEMRGIIKRFPGVLANDRVDFDLRAGEIHALLGENGAGKSTLMSVLAGLYKPEAGTIHVQGQPAHFNSPRDAIARGLGMIHQHFTLVPSQTVTENILLGLDEPRFLMRLPDYDQRMAELGTRFGLQITPQAKIWQLTVGEQQRVEILKMLYRGVQVLIMDEPTAVLAPQEIEELFKTLRAMAGEGKSIVFISHKLNEVMAIADRITVLRHGRVTAAGLRSADTSKAELAKLMVGRTVLFDLDKKPQAPGEVVLTLEGVCADNDKGRPALRNLSLTVRAGEIVGVAGVAGNGQSELAEVITGLRHCTAGRVLVQGEDITNRPARLAIHKGVAHVPEDRAHVGSAPNLSITDNVIMKSYRHPPLAKGGSLDRGAARRNAERLKEEYAILAPSVDTPVRLLSGGNLQRVILARELSAKPQLLIAMQPTRGLDVGAIEGVQRLLLAQREAGAAMLLVSEELEEIFALSDRIVVLYEGEIAGEITEHDPEAIGLMMTGGKRRTGG
ncbi:MAG: heme ABC transporter ATP-binding protein [Chloroflexi bacterium RBG_16_63_12]|jgi:simple sugar transport system ATP-binding protein|nr:putative transporter ATP-binding protein [Anaerolineales bacterium]OGO47652.1 MAG: heme ABC transporter ATP-binding protein [Chloroflexi bacterium RBG_16_63_12]